MTTSTGGLHWLLPSPRSPRKTYPDILHLGYQFFRPSVGGTEEAPLNRGAMFCVGRSPQARASSRHPLKGDDAICFIHPFI